MFWISSARFLHASCPKEPKKKREEWELAQYSEAHPRTNSTLRSHKNNTMSIRLVKDVVPLCAVTQEVPLVLHGSLVEAPVPDRCVHTDRVQAEPAERDLARDVVVLAAVRAWRLFVDVVDVVVGLVRRGDVGEVRCQVTFELRWVEDGEEHEALEPLSTDRLR